VAKAMILLSIFYPSAKADGNKVSDITPNFNR